MKLEIKGEEVNIVFRRYPNDRLAVALEMNTGEPYAIFSVNFPDVSDSYFEGHGFFAKVYQENEMLVQPLLDTGLFETTKIGVESGFCKYPLWKLSKAGIVALGKYGVAA